MSEDSVTLTIESGDLTVSGLRVGRVEGRGSFAAGTDILLEKIDRLERALDVALDEVGTHSDYQDPGGCRREVAAILAGKDAR